MRKWGGDACADPAAPARPESDFPLKPSVHLSLLAARMPTSQFSGNRIAVTARTKIVDPVGHTVKGDDLTILDKVRRIGPGLNPFLPVDRAPLRVLGCLCLLHECLDRCKGNHRKCT